ncbi:hypothetical protein Dsin_032509 [Dipteronia sinensis]|uniref:Uncharacterized protein n=1 Tax=Dipteronia sinensis TaxID=43782 RepID=A0AAD9Z8M0_9ROSI|nr:hypothetical protein Dsin_032509 [Dipteronia sinensis]
MKVHNVSVLAVSEPFQDVGLIRRCAMCLQFPNFSSNVKEGGKIWVFWKDNIQLEVAGSSNQCLTVLMFEDSGSLLTTFVYAKCSQIKRRELWEQLYAMAEFNECINRCGLLDLRFEGRQLYWCNGHQGLARSWAKLDRVLIDNEFVAKYGDAKACLLNRNTSNHAPILLQFVTDMERYGPTPFRFQNMWTSHVGWFLDVVGNSWNKTMVSESGLHQLVGKLKRMKQRLKVWNKETFGHVDGIIRELEERVEHYEEMLQAEYSEDI